jgi:hypothetical protein
MADIELTERHREDTAVVCGRVPHGEVGPFIQSAFGEVMAAIGGIPIVGPPFCRIDMADDDFLLEVGFPVERPIEAAGRVEPSELPGGTAATLVHVGPYESIAPAYGALHDWMTAHGYSPAGAPWESYLDGPEVAAPRTIVCWPCHREDSAPNAG